MAILTPAATSKIAHVLERERSRAEEIKKSEILIGDGEANLEQGIMSPLLYH